MSILQSLPILRDGFLNGKEQNTESFLRNMGKAGKHKEKLQPVDKLEHVFLLFSRVIIFILDGTGPSTAAMEVSKSKSKKK